MQGAAVVAFQMSLAHAAMPGPGDDQAPGDGGQIAPGFADVLLRQGRAQQAHKGVMGQVGGIVTVAQVFAQQAEGIHLLHVRYRGVVAASLRQLRTGRFLVRRVVRAAHVCVVQGVSHTLHRASVGCGSAMRLQALQRSADIGHSPGDEQAFRLFLWRPLNDAQA